MSEKYFKGKWRMVSMEQWSQAYIDLIEPGFIEFVDNGFGSFHFGTIYANIDYRVNGQGKAEFSFYGDDEGQEVFGRGWAKIDDKGLYGAIFFHEGDESEFQAIRETATKKYQNTHFKHKSKRSLRKERIDIFV